MTAVCLVRRPTFGVWLSIRSGVLFFSKSFDDATKKVRAPRVLRSVGVLHGRLDETLENMRASRPLVLVRVHISLHADLDWGSCRRGGRAVGDIMVCVRELVWYGYTEA